MTNRRNKSIYKRPKLVRRPTCHPATLPQQPGSYYWSEWNAVVEIVRRGRALWVTPPGGVPIKVTPFIAGKFKEV